jgi:hypothetical protein
MYKLSNLTFCLIDGFESDFGKFGLEFLDNLRAFVGDLAVSEHTSLILPEKTLFEMYESSRSGKLSMGESADMYRGFMYDYDDKSFYYVSYRPMAGSDIYPIEMSIGDRMFALRLLSDDDVLCLISTNKF